MNVDFDISVVTRLLQRIMTELREKRLWPVALGLLVATVAVPLLLSKSSSPPPVAQAPVGTPAPSPATSLPAVNVQTTPGHSRLTGHARDPFAQQASGRTATTSTAAATARATGTIASPVAATGTTTGATSPGATTGAPTATSTAPPSITPNAKPTPTLNALSATQSYHVTLAITNSSGGVDTIDPLERLSVLPSDKQPLLVELGVLKGGSHVLFVVQPGTVVSGPGTCTPGPIDCEILSLRQDQTESLSSQSPTGVVQGPLFAVTGITADDRSSATAADKARRVESATGRALLNASTLSALSLFQYEPSLGAVVDLRNLTVGGT